MAKAKGLPKSDRGWQTYLQNIKPPKARTWLPMGAAMELRLEPGGAKTFQARIRRIGDRNPRRIELGSFPAVSVAEARQRMTLAKSQAKEGKDPAIKQRRARARVYEVRTLADLVARYLERRMGDIAAKTLRLKKQLLEGVLIKALGDRLVSDIEPKDFGSIVGRYATRRRDLHASPGNDGRDLEQGGWNHDRGGPSEAASPPPAQNGLGGPGMARRAV